MNILHINENAEIKGGVEVYLSQLSALSPEFGIRSLLIACRKNKDNSYTSIENSNVKEPTIHRSLKELICYLEIFISKHSISVLHLHSVSDPQLIMECNKLLPVVRSMHEPRMICPGHTKYWRYSKRICNQPFGYHCLYHTYTEGCSSRHPSWLLKSFNNTHFEINTGAQLYKKIIVMSEYMKSEALEVGIPENKIVVNQYFTLPRMESNLYAAQISPNKRIVFMGRIIEHKGLHVLIKALLPIFSEFEDVVLDILGDGKIYDLLQDQLKVSASMNLENRIIFHGWKERLEIENAIEKSYMVIVPSLYPEAFGIVGIEAMMHGKPVVGFDVGGIRDWLVNNETGFLVGAGDIEGLRNSIKILLTNTPIWTHFALNAYRKAISAFTPKVHIHRLKGMYEDIVYSNSHSKDSSY